MTDYEKLPLFDFFKLFYSDSKEWDLIPDKVKSGHSYMLMQFLAIKVPEMMQFLNKSNSSVVVDILHEMFKHYGKPPAWMYTKTDKSKKIKNIDLSKYSKEFITLYTTMNNLNKKDFDMLLELHDTELKKYFDEQNKGYELKTK